MYIATLVINLAAKVLGNSSKFVRKLSNTLKNVKEIKLKHTSISIMFYNIICNNNKIVFDEKEGDLTATFTNGQYTINKLVTEIKFNFSTK